MLVLDMYLKKKQPQNIADTVKPLPLYESVLSSALLRRGNFYAEAVHIILTHSSLVHTHTYCYISWTYFTISFYYMSNRYFTICVFIKPLATHCTYNFQVFSSLNTIHLIFMLPYLKITFLKL